MNFEFHNPTRLIFGAGNLTRLGEVVKRKAKSALLVTGGGSVKRNGTFDRAVASSEAGRCDRRQSAPASSPTRESPSSVAVHNRP